MDNIYQFCLFHSVTPIRITPHDLNSFILWSETKMDIQTPGLKVIIIITAIFTYYFLQAIFYKRPTLAS